MGWHAVAWPPLHGFAGSIERTRGADTGAMPGGISMYMRWADMTMSRLPEAGSWIRTICCPSVVSSMRILDPPKYITPVAGELSDPPLIRRSALNCWGACALANPASSAAAASVAQAARRIMVCLSTGGWGNQLESDAV